MDAKRLVESKSQKRILGGILAKIDKYHLTETGTLRKSVRVKIGGTAENPTVEVFSVYYGKFVRANLLERKGVDLFDVDTSSIALELAKNTAANIASELKKEIKQK